MLLQAVHACTNAHYWLGQQPRKRTQCWGTVLDQTEGTEEDRLKVTSGRTRLQWGRLADLTWNQQNFTIHQGALYLCSMPKGESDRPSTLHSSLRPIVSPPRMGAIENPGHQGCDCTLSLLWEHFWWPGMANQMQQSIKSCAWLFTTWGWPVQCASIPNCGHCSYRPLACRLY